MDKDLPTELEDAGRETGWWVMRAASLVHAVVVASIMVWLVTALSASAGEQAVAVFAEGLLLAPYLLVLSGMGLLFGAMTNAPPRQMWSVAALTINSILSLVLLLPGIFGGMIVFSTMGSDLSQR
ncbi:hypothetical protein [Arthrobacter sp. H5]|uniref:hypothetical protein n=1 Tax=Arthrobacter sp. H5 TaxID=1267973 RepID=UPI000486E9F8|nr:hypothetical protein [Arthrobacter sp. H5]